LENILAIIFVISLIGIPISLVIALIKKLRKKTVKKTLKFTGVFLLALILSFCGIGIFVPDSSDLNEEQNGIVSNSNMTYDNSTDDDNPIEVGDSDGNSIFNSLLGSDDAEYIDVHLHYLGWMADSYDSFSEGRAWVQFYDPNNRSRSKVAIIDEQGRIIWESESTEASIALREKSVFRDGVAYCLFDGDAQDTYMIFDHDGNVTFTKEYDGNYIILGHGNGMFLVAEHIQNFETNEWRIGAIDKNGKILIPFQVYDTSPITKNVAVEAPSGEAPDPNYDYGGYLDYMEQLEAYEEYINYSYTPKQLSFDVDINDSDSFGSCEYMGDNVYKLAAINGRWSILLNIETQSVIYAYDFDYNIRFGTGTIEFISHFEDGVATVLHRYSYLKEDGIYENKSVVCELTTNGDLTPIADNSFTKHILPGRIESFSDGLFYMDANDIEAGVLEEIFPPGAYYNLEGECVIDFPEYPDKYKYWGEQFHNGYAVMNIEGADGNIYITAIDKNGELLFEPKAGYYFGESFDGKYILAYRNGCIEVYDFDWNPVVTIECECISMSNLENLTAMNDGILRVDNIYINLEDRKVIGKHTHVKASGILEINITWH